MKIIIILIINLILFRFLIIRKIKIISFLYQKIYYFNLLLKILKINILFLIKKIIKI